MSIMLLGIFLVILLNNMRSQLNVFPGLKMLLKKIDICWKGICILFSKFQLF